MLGYCLYYTVLVSCGVVVPSASKFKKDGNHHPFLFLSSHNPYALKDCNRCSTERELST